MSKLSSLRMMVLAVAAWGVAACASDTPPSTRAQALVENARWSVEAFKQSSEKPAEAFRKELKGARGLVVIPAALKGAFLVGAEGGNGILLARDEAGTWSYPAFYTLGAGSFGLQIGGRSAEIVLVLRSDAAVDAIIKHQGKLGADLEIIGGHIGAGMETSTTANVGADIVAFARGAGLYGGLSLEGAVLAKRNDLNEAYYGSSAATAETIVLQRQFQNAQAEPLRAALATN